MRKQYHFWPATSGENFDAWDVDRLIELARDLPVTSVRFTTPVAPDFSNCRPDELPYNRQ